jgi:hypothetical protein
MPSSLRRCLSSLAAALLLSPATLAFDSPLSDQTVREAYFLGQRHDGSFAILLFDKYTKRFPLPKTGPHIFSIALLTPFMQLAQHSDRYFANYSAQQATIDHRGHEETVQIIVSILLTESYGRIVVPAADSPSRTALPPFQRPYDFWKDFEVQVFDGEHALAPSSSRGHADYNCAYRGPCLMYGATVVMEFPAESFPSNSISVHIIPPEGEPVSADFDLTRRR